MQKIKFVAFVSSLALLLGSCGSATGEENNDQNADTITLRYATYLTEEGTDSKVASWWFDRVEELTPNYSINVDTFYGGSLLPAEDTLKGVAEGRADIAFFNTPYHPSELPLSQIGTVPFLSDSGEATARAAADLYESHEEFRAEYEKNDVVPVLFSVVANNTLGFAEEVDSLADMRGKKVRATGFTAQALERVGASPIVLEATEIYESVEQGLIDGFATLPFPNAVNSFAVHEVAPYFLDTGLGQYALGVSLLMSADKWESLPQEVQDAMRMASEEAIDVNADLLTEEGDVACQSLREVGGYVTRLSQAEIDEWKSATFEDALAEWKARAVQAGVTESEADEFAQEYQNRLNEYATPDAVDVLTRCAESAE